MPDERMLSCPFCGKPGYLHHGEYGGQHFYPRCRTAHCVGNQGWVSFDTEDDAIKAWNTRHLITMGDIHVGDTYDLWGDIEDKPKPKKKKRKQIKRKPKEVKPKLRRRMQI